MAQCTANSKQSGERCERHAMIGRTVCYMHGGKSRRGPAHPNFKTGKFVSSMPQRLVDSYTTAISDQTLYEVRDEIALLHARLEDLLLRVDQGEAGDLWRRLQKTFSQFQVAKASGDVKAMGNHLATLEQLIERGASDAEAWEEVYTVIKERDRLISSETKRATDIGSMVAVQDLMGMFNVMFTILTKWIPDKGVLNGVLNEIDQQILHGPGPGPRLLSGGVGGVAGEAPAGDGE